MIYLVNIAGQGFYIRLLMRNGVHKQERHIDNGNFDRSKLVEMKIPFHAPYYSSSPGYERFYGEANINGSFYSYVERKIQKDTIYLICLPNDENNFLQHIKLNLSKSNAAQDGQEKNGKQTQPKKNTSDQEMTTLAVNIEPFSTALTLMPAATGSHLVAGYSLKMVKPPCC